MKATLAIRQLLAVVLLVVLVGLVTSTADAQTITAGPSVRVDRYEFAPGDRIVLTITGFTSNSVIVAVCGNDARRGSTDCNMTGAEGRRVQPDGVPTVAEMPVEAPPMPCPCVIRVSDASQTQVAVVSVVLVGHPVAPVVGSPPPNDPIDVAVAAVRSEVGFSDDLRAGLGGAADFDVTVTVRNRSDSPIEGVRLSGSAGRSPDEDLVSIDFTDPGAIDAGSTWTETVTVELPAAVFSEVEWRATASGAGPTVTATDTTRSVPWLLWLLVAILVIDLLILLVRFVMRLIRRSRGEPDDNSLFDEPVFDPDGDIEADVLETQRERQLV